VEATVADIVAGVADGRLPAERLADAAARSVALATATRPGQARPADAAHGQEEIGLAAARRALRVHGVVPAARRPLIVELDAPPTVAVGEVPWGLLPYLERTAADADLVRLRPLGGAPIDVPALVHRSAGGPIVLVTRDTHRHERIRALIEDITAAHPQVVLVEMGWPAWRPPRALGYLATYGAGPANARAAAEAILPAR
jgi:beta-N-acetylhexosaminidase